MNTLLRILALVIGIAFILGVPSRAGFLTDEGDRLSLQIARTATRLRNSEGHEATVVYRPRAGIYQRYRIVIAKADWQPHVPLKPPFPGLTVWVEKGHGGFCNYHVRFAGVPRTLEIQKNGASTELVLRKTANGIIEVVDLR